MLAAIVLLATGSLLRAMPVAAEWQGGNQDELETYVSPTWGYALEFDPDQWDVVDERSSGGFDRLELFNGPSFVTIAGLPDYAGDPVACRDDWERLFRQSEGIEEYTPLLNDAGDPVAGLVQGVAYAAFTYTSADGAEVIDLRCSTLVPGVGNLLIVFETFADQYAEQVETLADLLAGLDFSDVEEPDPDMLAEEPGDLEVGSPRRPSDEGVDQILIVDKFNDPSVSRLSSVSPAPDQVRYAYEEGEFVIATIDPAAGIWQAGIDGVYADVSIAVDVRLVGETDGRAVLLGCRYRVEDARNSEYTLIAKPAAATVMLVRWDEGESTFLTEELPAPSFKPATEQNRIELSCVGETIRALVNGVAVAAVEDDRFASGYLYIAAGSIAGEGTCEARFDDLFITIFED